MSTREAGTAEQLAERAKARIAAMLGSNTAALEGLLHDDLIYIHSSARLDTKQSYIESIATKHVAYTNFEPSDIRFVEINDETAIRTGHMKIGAVVKGEPKPLNVAFVEVWVKTGSSWQLISFQATPRGIMPA